MDTDFLPLCSLKLKGAEPSSICAHAAHIPSAAKASWLSSAGDEGLLLTEQGALKHGGCRRAARSPLRDPPGRFSHRRVSDTKEAAVSMQVHPVGAVPLILTWFSFVVQYVKHMYEGHTCTTQRKQHLCIKCTVSSSEKNFEWVKNCWGTELPWQNKGENPLYDYSLYYFISYSKAQWIWLLLLVVTVVQAWPKMQPLPWRSFLYQ